MKHLRNRKIFFVSSLVASVTLCSSAVAQMQDLGPGVYPHAISGDGTVVAGDTLGQIFRWTCGRGMELIGTIPGFLSDMSDDGDTMVGSGSGGGFVWTKKAGWRQAGYDTEMNAVSNDGLSIYGAYFFNDFFFPRWIPCVWSTETLARQDLAGNFGYLHDPIVYGVAGNGSVVYGRGIIFYGEYDVPQSHFFKWTATGGPTVLQRAYDSYPSSVSYDGSVFAAGDRYWQNGSLSSFGGGFFGRSVSGDGKVFAGSSTFSGGYRAARRTSDGGVQFLWNDYSGGRDMSSDGTAIVGSYTVSGQQHGFIWAPDRDEDGLLDEWEAKQGIDIDGDGNKEVELKGANPDRKDLFIEVDLMEGIGTTFDHLDRNVFRLVQQAFRNAPVKNVGNQPDGINLHFVKSDADIPYDLISRQNVDDKMETWKDQHFGEPDSLPKQRTKERVYRHLVIADASADNDRGFSSGIPGTSMVLFYGNLDVRGSRQVQACTIMHELGHNLGLFHGGGPGPQQEDISKPNYVSVMSYLYSPDTLPDNTPVIKGWNLDFSSEALDLDENSLNELPGQSLRYSRNPAVGMPFVTGIPLGLKWATLDGRGIDWNGDSVLDAAGVATDINFWPDKNCPIKGWENSSFGQTLTGHNDWAALLYSPARAAYWDFKGGMTASRTCLTNTEMDTLQDALPKYAVLKINIAAQSALPPRQGVLQIQALPNGIVESRPVTISELDQAFTPIPAAEGRYRVRFLDKGALSTSAVITIQPGVSQGINLNVYHGDIDGDNTVSLFDYLILSENFDKTLDSPDWYSHSPGGASADDADLNCDGVVSVFDFLILRDNFDQEGD